jgi:hypothetical protein
MGRRILDIAVGLVIGAAVGAVGALTSAHQPPPEPEYGWSNVPSVAFSPDTSNWLMSNVIRPFLHQMAAQSPLLLVYLVAIVLALMFCRRYPGVSLFLLAGALLLFLTTVVQTLLIQFPWFEPSYDTYSWPEMRLSWGQSAINVACTLLRALGFGLLLAAVFRGRRAAHQVNFDS